MEIWIRDNAQGVGTLTWLDEDNSFGALGHGINDMDTAELMNLGKRQPLQYADRRHPEGRERRARRTDRRDRL